MKKARKKLFLSLAYFLEFFLGSIALYLTLVIITSLIPINADFNETDGVKIYVKTNGVHTDICLPVVNEYVDWRGFIPIADFPDVSKHNYVSVGWGDKGFFLDTPEWSDLTFGTAFSAAFLPSETAMHVAYLETEPVLSFNTKQKYVHPDKYQDLIRFIKSSFKTNGEKIDLIPGKGYWKNDNFYEARGSYHLFNTCNAWTNQALKIAGVRTAFLALFSDGIMRHLE